MSWRHAVIKGNKSWLNKCPIHCGKNDISLLGQFWNTETSKKKTLVRHLQTLGLRITKLKLLIYRRAHTWLSYISLHTLNLCTDDQRLDWYISNYTSWSDRSTHTWLIYLVKYLMEIPIDTNLIYISLNIPNWCIDRQILDWYIDKHNQLIYRWTHTWLVYL